MSDLQTTSREGPSDLHAGAAAAALAAAAHAGVEIRLLDSLPEFEAASGLIARVWSDDDPKAPAALLRALSHAGNFVAGAFSDGELVGVSIGFFGRDDGDDDIHLHSHITGVDARFQNRSVGFALKQFQRGWALEHGARSIRWTADPLVRRNLYFNLVKLGATVVSYHADFYGPILDGVNGPGQSDRVLFDWELGSPRAVRIADAQPVETAAAPGTIVLQAGPDGNPVASSPDGETLLIWVPDDIVGLRRDDPEQAAAWRQAMRLAAGRALADGYRAEAITRGGWLVLTR
ncbi:MAG: GNAT family N-acetyltransferase [Gaiellaceae bacterium]